MKGLKDIPDSEVPKMLIDPGKFYASLIVDLQQKGIPDLIICYVLEAMLPQLMAATVAEDRPASVEEFRTNLSTFVKTAFKADD